jgi:WD40 repeat protein
MNGGRPGWPRTVIVGTGALISALVVVSTCEPGADSNRPEQSVRFVDVPSSLFVPEQGDYRSVAWLAPDRLVVGYEPNSDRPTFRLWTVAGGKLEPFVVPITEPCPDARLGGVEQIGDGSIAFARLCHPPGINVGDAPRELREIMIFKPATNEVTSVGQTEENVGQFSIRPDRQRTMVAFGSRICQGVGELVGGSLQALHLVVRDNGRSFDLADQLTSSKSDCTSTGRADSPAWEPDGSTFAMLASVEAVGVDGQRRLDAPMALLVWPDQGEPRILVRGITNVLRVAWDPTGHWLAFGGGVRGSGSGTWLVNVPGNLLVRVDSRPASGLAWSPDGQELAITYFRDPESWPPRAELVRLDLSKVLAASL